VWDADKHSVLHLDQSDASSKKKSYSTLDAGTIQVSDGGETETPKTFLASEETSRIDPDNKENTELTNDERLAAEIAAQEVVASELAGKGSSEYEAYRDFLKPINDEILALRKIFLQIPSRRRLCLVVDCSGSMCRFDSVDSRFGRSMEIAALIMEACWGMENKWDYCIVAHNGKMSCIDLVQYGKPPINGKERFRVLQRMIAQSQHCQGGDNTLETIVEVAKSGQSDLIVVISDAYLQKHDIYATDVVRTLRHCKGVSTAEIYFAFMASHVSEATDIIQEIPKDHGFACRDSSEIPSIFQLILENLEPKFPKQEGVRENLIDLVHLRDEVIRKEKLKSDAKTESETLGKWSKS
jgi:hypothetical protein